MEGLYGRVGIFVHREDGAAGATFGVFVVEGGVVDEFVVSECLSPYGFNVAMFGFRKGNNVGVGMGGEYAFKVYYGCVHTACIEGEGN